MNIVDFFKKQVDIYNEDLKCGFCWTFSAPLKESQTNIVQSETNEEDCCVHVFLTDPGFRENITRNNQTNLITSRTCIDTITAWVLMKVPLGVNNYNEIKGHPIEESKWNTVFYPIRECLGCENILDTCEILGETNMNVDLTNGIIVHNYIDDNYNGWKISYTFTQVK